MQALVFEGVRDVRTAHVPDPILAGPGEVIVRVRHAAICGSDLHVYRGVETGLDAGNVKALATMPSLDQLRATLAGMLKQPATRIASILQAPGGQIARVLAAHPDKGNAA